MFNRYIYELSTTSYDRDRDLVEIIDLYEKYGDQFVSVVRSRARDACLSRRNRNHWCRIAKAINYFGSGAVGLERRSTLQTN